MTKFLSLILNAAKAAFHFVSQVSPTTLELAAKAIESANIPGEFDAKLVALLNRIAEILRAMGRE